MARIPKVLTAKQVEKKLKALSAWEVNKKNTQLSKTFQSVSFINGLAFIAKMTVHAEIMNHHPDVELSYSKVKVKLTTHDLKGLSKADFELASKIDQIRMP